MNFWQALIIIILQVLVLAGLFSWISINKKPAEEKKEDRELEVCRIIRKKILEAKNQEEMRFALDMAATHVYGTEAKWSHMAFLSIIPLISLRKEVYSNYSISLQRAIEFHCRGEKIPHYIARECPFHANKLNENLTGKEDV